MRITIRPATMADAPGITEIFNDAILNTTAIYAYQPVPVSNREQYLHDRQAQGFPVLVACRTDDLQRVLGYASYGTFRAFPAFQYTCENSVYVHPQARGLGLGKQLLQATIEHATQAGLHMMVAGIDASNELSIDLHAKFGFEHCALIKQAGFKFNRWLDLVFMQKILSDTLPQQ